MKTLTLNIGLDTNDGHKLAIHRACAQLANTFQVIQSRVTASPNGDEQVLVAIVEDRNDSISKCYDLAKALNQDCISTSDGELIGPHADKWGEFNPDFFVPFEDTPQEGGNPDSSFYDADKSGEIAFYGKDL